MSFGVKWIAPPHRYYMMRPMMHDASDDDLIRSYREGSVEAFERLYRRHAPGLFTWLRLQAGHEAEDLLQETFSRASAALPRYRPEGRFAAWLWSIARNLLRDRGRKPSREVPLDDATSPCGDTGMAERESGKVTVREALMTLPAEQREVVVLREYAGLSFPEIARVVGCPQNTAITRMHRALERLRRLLMREEVEAVEL